MDELTAVGTSEPGQGQDAVEQTLALTGIPTQVRASPSNYVPTFTGKRYGYAMAQIMARIYGKSAGELVKHMARNRGLLASTNDLMLLSWRWFSCP
jgi:hypothetical protein